MIRIIDKIAMEYPALDLASIRILMQIDDMPGLSIREVAEILVMDYKTVCLKIALMANGRGEKMPRARKYRLITVERNTADRRKRNLYLTGTGKVLASQLNPLSN